MLTSENNHCLVKHHHIVDTAFLSAFTFVMDDACARIVIVLITSLNDTIREVNVFAIHEEGLIQQTHFI